MLPCDIIAITLTALAIIALVVIFVMSIYVCCKAKAVKKSTKASKKIDVEQNSAGEYVLPRANLDEDVEKNATGKSVSADPSLDDSVVQEQES